jgi:hypothetical protein
LKYINDRLNIESFQNRNSNMKELTEIDLAIDGLQDLKRRLNDPYKIFHALAPYSETDFVPWFFAGCKHLGMTEIPISMLKQACAAKNIELTISAGHWFRNFGFTKSRVYAGQKWYDLTYNCYAAGDLHRTIYGKAPE